MSIINNIEVTDSLLIKIIKMFYPSRSDFFEHPKETVIQGPNDRALIGFDTYFPIPELVEDFGFTEEEAKTFVKLVGYVHSDEEGE